jgi:ferredoxin
MSGGGEWTVEVDSDVCVGNKMCVALAGDVFDIVDGKSRARVPRVTPSPAVADAYESCPVSAIVLRDEDGLEIETDA